MIRTLCRAQDGTMKTELKVEELTNVLQDATNLLWLDIFDETKELSVHLLCEVFHFHPLAVDDALEESHVPKVEDWGQYIYLDLHSIIFNLNAEDLLHTPEADIFLGGNYLVTYHKEPILALDRVWESCLRDERYLQKGVGRVLYRLADELVADYLPVVEAIDEIIDRIEDRVFEDPKPSVLEQIFTLKRALLLLRRILMHQREVLNKLSRGDYPLVDPEDRIFFRDVYDHLVRLHDITEGLRDLLAGTLDTYLSVVSNRMNEVMKTLTVITTLFMPLSFLTGFFGMNFFGPTIALPMWTGRTAFIIMLAFAILTPSMMFLWMRRRAWM